VKLMALAAATFALWSLASPVRSETTSSARRVIHSVFGSQSREAIRVARCESKLDPRAVGGAGELGLFQIHPSHFGKTLRSRAGKITVRARRLLDPIYNARVALVLSHGGTRWRPWTCQP